MESQVHGAPLARVPWDPLTDRCSNPQNHLDTDTMQSITSPDEDFAKDDSSVSDTSPGNTSATESAPSGPIHKKNRPCKGKRLRYKRLVERLRAAIVANPETFDVDDIVFPPSMSDERQQRLKKELEAYQAQVFDPCLVSESVFLQRTATILSKKWVDKLNLTVLESSGLLNKQEMSFPSLAGDDEVPTNLMCLIAKSQQHGTASIAESSFEDSCRLDWLPLFSLSI